MSRARRSRSCSRPRPRAPSRTRGGAVVGFLLGTPRADTTWGPNVWVEGAGHAVEQAEDVRDLYAPRRGALGRGGPHVSLRGRAGERRAARRRLVPPRLRPAARPCGPRGSADSADARCPTASRSAARRATTSTSSPTLELALPAHQQLSPVFSSLPPQTFEEVRAEWEEDFDNPAFATFVAVVDGRVVGSAVGCSVTVSGSTRESCAPTTRASSASPPCCPRPAAPGSARCSARPCSTGRRQRATAPSPPTGARRTCSRRAPGRSSAGGRRSTGFIARSPDDSLIGWVRDPHPSPLGLARAARHGRRRRDPAAATPAARPAAGHRGGGRRGAALSALRATPRRSRHARRAGRDRRRASLAAAPGRADRSAPAGGRGRDRRSWSASGCRPSSTRS